MRINAWIWCPVIIGCSSFRLSYCDICVHCSTTLFRILVLLHSYSVLLGSIRFGAFSNECAELIIGFKSLGCLNSQYVFITTTSFFMAYLKKKKCWCDCRIIKWHRKSHKLCERFCCADLPHCNGYQCLSDNQIEWKMPRIRKVVQFNF